MTLTVLSESLQFGEAPRWHQGQLWFSDILGHAVKTWNGQTVNTEFEVEGHPSGLGWLPDGTLLVVSMLDQKLLAYRDGVLSQHADMTGFAKGSANDMVVDQYGNAFVGHLGFDYEKGEAPATTNLVRVRADGTVGVAADEMACANGMAILGDKKTLIVGQSLSSELLAFDIAPNGELSNRRVYATMPEGYMADGICVDEEGAVWVAVPIHNEFIRVAPQSSAKQSEILQRISTADRHAIACTLGGKDRRTLFACTSASMSLTGPEPKYARLECVDVGISGAGVP